MMLMQKNTEPFCIMQAVQEPDGQSGTRTVWREGAAFEGAALIGQTAQSVITKGQSQTAQMPDPKPQYALYTPRAVSLPFHAVVRRDSDGQYFRILSDPTDSKTPKGALLDLRLYAAEKWRRPDDES